MPLKTIERRVIAAQSRGYKRTTPPSGRCLQTESEAVGRDAGRLSELKMDTQTVDELINYAKSGHVGERLKNVHAHMTDRELWPGSLELLGWLRCRPRDALDRRGRDVDYCRIRAIIEGVPELQKAFVVYEDRIEFGGALTDEERTVIERYVFDHYVHEFSESHFGDLE